MDQFNPQVSYLQEDVAELTRQLDDLKFKLDSTTRQIEDLTSRFSRHNHNGNDSSLPMKIVLKPEEDAQFGCTFIDSYENPNGTYEAYFVSGKENPDSRNFPSTQLTLSHQPGTNGTTNQSFYYGFRPPLYFAVSGSVTSGGSTLAQTLFAWTTNELAGAYVTVFDSSGVTQFTRQIASNTATTITIDGTWPASVSGTFQVTMPVYLGAAEYPWRQGYFLGEDVSSGGDGSRRRALRFGFGTTSGPDVIGVYFGTGTPEGAVTANVGSLYLRVDGSTSTTLYVKTSGTGNTGWTAK